MKRVPNKRDLKLHPHAHHLVRTLALALFADGTLVSDACRLAGIHRSNYSDWIHRGTKPDLVSIEALGTVAGLRLVWKPIYQEETKNEKRKNVKARRKRRRASVESAPNAVT